MSCACGNSDHRNPRRKVREKVLSEVVTAGGVTSAVERVARLTCPSRAIHASITITSRSSNGEPPADLSSCLWTLRAGIRGPKGFEPANTVVDGQALPGGYEFQSAATEWEAVATLDPATFSSLAAGQIMVTATWEIAAECCLSDSDMEALFGECNLSVDGDGNNAAIRGGE